MAQKLCKQEKTGNACNVDVLTAQYVETLHGIII